MINAVRGEVAVKIGDVDLIMVATMDGLARLSAATGRPTFSQLYERLIGAEIESTLTAIRIFTTGGTTADGKKLKPDAAASAAIESLDLTGLLQLQPHMVELIGSLLKPASDSPEGKDSPNP